MRCPSCGTENAPDSRFCGGCGGKLTPATGATPRLAPTAKIPDDAQFPTPQQSVQTGQRAQIPQGYQSGPPSIPPTANPYAATGPASIPPTASRGPASIPPHASFQRAPTPAPMEASMSGRPTPLAPGLRPASQGPGAEPAFASMPPTQQRKIRTSTPLPDGSMPGDSLIAPAQRPLGLIAIVLVVDLALCGAGAVMLSKGLSAKKHKLEPGPPKAPEQKMEQRSEAMPAPTPPAPTPAPAPSESPSEAVAAAAPQPIADAKADTKVAAAAGKLVESKPEKPDKQARAKDSKKKDGKSAGSAPKSGGGGAPTGASGPVTHPGGGSPEDPYKDQGAQPAPAATGFDLKAESNKQAAASNDLFARCVSAAGGVHGTIKVAYRVEADGRVVHPYAVENSTGNEQLGICLADVIATWHFSQHTGEAQNAVRPFTY